MSIGIIGAGKIGQAFARTLARAGVKATISNSRGPDSLTDLVSSLGSFINAGTREQAATADVVFIAVNWTKLSSALAALPAWGNRIVIAASNRPQIMNLAWSCLMSACEVPRRPADAEFAPNGEQSALSGIAGSTPVSSDHLRWLPECAQEGTAHAVTIGKTRLPGDDFDRMP